MSWAYCAPKSTTRTGWLCRSVGCASLTGASLTAGARRDVRCSAWQVGRTGGAVVLGHVVGAVVEPQGVSTHRAQLLGAELAKGAQHHDLLGVATLGRDADQPDVRRVVLELVAVRRRVRSPLLDLDDARVAPGRHAGAQARAHDLPHVVEVDRRCAALDERWCPDGRVAGDEDAAVGTADHVDP